MEIRYDCFQNVSFVCRIEVLGIAVVLSMREASHDSFCLLSDNGMEDHGKPTFVDNPEPKLVDHQNRAVVVVV